MLKKYIRQEPGNISFLFKTLWGLGFLGGGMIAGVSGAFQLIYYQNYLGLSAQVYSICIVLYTLFNAVNNPFVAYLSDQTSSKIGRRLPYFRLSAPFVVVSFVMLYFVPLELNLMFTATWFFICLLIFDLAYSTYCSMYLNLQTEITDFENERIDLQLSCEVSNYIGTVVGMVLPGLITLNLLSDSSLIEFRTLILIVAVVGLILMLGSSFIVKERTNLDTIQFDKSKRNIRSALKEYVEIFKIKPIRKAVMINFFANAAINLTTPLLYYVAIFVLKMEASLFVVIVMLPTIFSLPVWMKVQRRFGAVRAGESALLLGFVGFIIAGLMQNNIVMIISFGFAGAAIAGMRLTLRNLLSDCVDYDFTETGKRREGVVFGAHTFTNAFTFMLIAIIPIILDVTGFVTASENNGVNLIDQPLSAVWGIRILIIFAGMFALLSFITLLSYSLKGEKLREIREKVRLQNRH